MTWQENFNCGSEIILATSSHKLKPNANVVISLGFVDNRLMIADCQMVTTLNNLKENPQVCVISKYFKICGIAEILLSGRLFDKCVEIVSTQDSSLVVKNAILITVKEVFDLEKVKKII
jgi:predicted pyridoxine 5'-phosphate oxidase superfamily flavin-nucleotide-binding protein